MVPKQQMTVLKLLLSFRAVLFRMVPKPSVVDGSVYKVLELCCFEWFQNFVPFFVRSLLVLELCCFEWFQNYLYREKLLVTVLELCCFEWFQNSTVSTLPLG